MQTNITVLGYRNPFLLAKAATTLDVLSGGRLILGVAAGYLKREFQALGADFDARNDVADETIRAMKRAWTEEGVELIGRHFAATGNTQLPRPIQKPHPPLWVGGNSAARDPPRGRARRRLDPVPDDRASCPSACARPRSRRMAEFDERLAYARAYAEEIGRTRHLDVTFVPFGLSMHAPEKIDPSEFAENIDALGRARRHLGDARTSSTRARARSTATWWRSSAISCCGRCDRSRNACAQSSVASSDRPSVSSSKSGSRRSPGWARWCSTSAPPA